jgi:hypothetical protein
MPDDPFKKLGTSVVTAELCSLCGEEISDEHMPLILRTGDREKMWVYCAKCEKVITQIVPKRKT